MKFVVQNQTANVWGRSPSSCRRSDSRQKRPSRHRGVPAPEAPIHLRNQRPARKPEDRRCRSPSCRCTRWRPRTPPSRPCQPTLSNFVDGFAPWMSTVVVFVVWILCKPPIVDPDPSCVIPIFVLDENKVVALYGFSLWMCVCFFRRLCFFFVCVLLQYFSLIHFVLRHHCFCVCGSFDFVWYLGLIVGKSEGSDLGTFTLFFLCCNTKKYYFNVLIGQRSYLINIGCIKIINMIEMIEIYFSVSILHFLMKSLGPLCYHLAVCQYSDIKYFQSECLIE